MVDAYNSVYIKTEAVYGTDAVPAPINAVLTRNMKMTPVLSDKVERKLDKPSRGATAVGVTNLHRGMDFEVELTGSGTAGTAAKFMELLRHAGMEAPLIAPGVSATQKFAALGAALASASLYGYRGTTRRRYVGARADLTAINFTAGAYPYFSLNYLGMIPAGAVEDQVAMAGSPDLTGWQNPVEVNTVNTDFALDGYAAVLRSFTLQANTQMTFRNLVGANYIQRGNHALKGKIVIEAPGPAKDYFAALRIGQEVAVLITHGLGAGNIVELGADYLQILDISDAEEDDVAMYELDVQLNLRAGQDDVRIICK